MEKLKKYKNYHMKARDAQFDNPKSVAVDYDDLSDGIEFACNALDEEGYDVISIIPTADGVFDTSGSVGSSKHLGWGYGFSKTKGAIITGRLRDH